MLDREATEHHRPTQNINSAFIHGLEKLEQVHGQQSKCRQRDLVIRIVVPEHLPALTTCCPASRVLLTSHLSSVRICS